MRQVRDAGLHTQLESAGNVDSRGRGRGPAGGAEEGALQRERGGPAEPRRAPRVRTAWPATPRRPACPRALRPELPVSVQSAPSLSAAGTGFVPLMKCSLRKKVQERHIPAEAFSRGCWWLPFSEMKKCFAVCTGDSWHKNLCFLNFEKLCSSVYINLSQLSCEGKRKEFVSCWFLFAGWPEDSAASS